MITDPLFYAAAIPAELIAGMRRHLQRSPPAFVKRDAASKAAALAWLGAQGVLLIDPLPFALAYTKLAGQHGALRATDAGANSRFGSLCLFRL